MIRCLIVDDEAYAGTLLAEYVGKVPFLSLVGVTTSALEALAWVQQGRVDLVFLDIQMPELTGMQLLRLCGSRCRVVLTTAYPQYALEGFEHDVVDYLVKPIAFERFLKASQKALPPAPAAPATPAEPGAAGPDYMFVKGDAKNKFVRVSYADISYVEGLKNYVSIQLPARRLITYHTLRELETELPRPPFVRVHKSYIVALDKVRAVEGNQLFIQEATIPVGDTYREQLYELIRGAR